MGHEHIETPNLDRLAAEGLTFTRGYTAAPLCRPALASIATGLYPHQHGVIGNDPAFEFPQELIYREEWTKIRMELDQPLIDAFRQLPALADLLGEQGYLSLQTGKWWEGDYSYGGFTEGMTLGDQKSGGSARAGDEGFKIGREGLDIIFEFIHRAQEEEKPFFIWYAPLLPHSPHNPPDSLAVKYLPLAPTPAEANYWACCEWFDITCGQLMSFIEEEGLSENTLFVFVTDNGWIQDPDRPHRAAPRSKRSPYEFGIRTPIIFRWTGSIEPHMDNEHLVSSIDIASTIVKTGGALTTEEMQGINVLDPANIEERKTLFSEAYAHDFSTIDSSLYYRIALELPWKLILPDESNRPDAVVELFNLLEDPHETVNLAPSHPEVVARLKAKIEDWWQID